jgi:hypothetical protein
LFQTKEGDEAKKNAPKKKKRKRKKKKPYHHAGFTIKITSLLLLRVASHIRSDTPTPKKTFIVSDSSKFCQ